MRFEVDLASAAGDEGDGAGDFSSIDVALDGFVDTAEALGRHTHVFGLGGGQVRREQRGGQEGEQQEGDRVDRFHGYQVIR
jgi:hypothetical protein